MPSCSWKILPTVAVLALGSLAHAANYRGLEAMVNGPWHHLPNAVNVLQFNRDDAKCRVVAAQTPVSSTTPAVVEMVLWSTRINCLRSMGYEPGVGAIAKPAVRKSGLAGIRAAGGGIGVAQCSEFTKSLSRPEMEAIFFSWTEGYLTGWNLGLPDKSKLHVDLSSLARDDQMEFLRGWCVTNPDKKYVEGATALLVRLREPK